MQKLSTIILISFLLLSNSIEVIARDADQEDKMIQVSTQSTLETTTSTENSNDIERIETSEETNDPYVLKNDQSSKENISDDSSSSEKNDSQSEHNPLEEIDKSSRKLGGNTGRWFVINGENMFFNPNITIKKDSLDPIVFSKIISQNSGSSTNFSETILFSDAIVLKSLPEVIAPSNTTYTIEYSVDKINFDSVPPNDVAQLKGIKVVFSSMVSSQRVEIKNTATIAWGNTHSGINEFAQFFEDDRLNGTVSFDSYRMVTAAYVDEFGSNLIDPKIFYGELGQEYTTSELDIPNYKLISVPKNATGKFLDEDQLVTYVYERREGSPVHVDYTDTAGRELVPSDTLTGKVGLPYETAAKDIPGWTLTETPTNANGIFSDEAQTVSYVYDRVEATPITVQYLDTEGHTLVSSETLTGKVGLPYETAAKDIPGWTLTETPANANGIFSDEAQTVSYVYDRVEATPVTVQYLDTEGHTLASSETLTGKVGLPYETVAKDIPGWTLTETPTNANGTFSDEAQTVSYVYDRVEATPVTVQYLDTEGHTLASSETLTGKVGLPYETAAKDIPGWTLTETPTNANGTFSDETQTVSYVYTKVLIEESTKTPNNHFSTKNKSSGNSSNSSVQHNYNKRQLPDTGEKTTFYLNIAGVTGLALFSVLYFYKRKSNR
ncbi:MucBP domain-containing protein [Enterococcus sp. AZ126]|uniref:MucBP domain-containing protein n=1 Tax=Enterococcus sp. AZ126 TaxID=2774635 RepID=UPI003F26F387